MRCGFRRQPPLPHAGQRRHTDIDGAAVTGEAHHMIVLQPLGLGPGQNAGHGGCGGSKGRHHAVDKQGHMGIDVDQLCRTVEENVNLATCSGDQITNIYTAETHFVLRPNFPLYKPFPAHCTGVGRVFLSHMSEAAQKWVYDNNADAIKMTQEEFLAMLQKARKDGYALDDQAFSAGLRCVAAPIYLYGNKLLLALSVSAPAARMDDASYERARQLVLKYADLISQEIQAVEFRF